MLFRSGVVNGGGYFLLLRDTDQFGRAMFLFSFLISWLCASLMFQKFRHYVVAEARCNRYLLDINISPLSEKVYFACHSKKNFPLDVTSWKSYLILW